MLRGDERKGEITSNMDQANDEWRYQRHNSDWETVAYLVLNILTTAKISPILEDSWEFVPSSLDNRDNKT